MPASRQRVTNSYTQEVLLISVSAMAVTPRSSAACTSTSGEDAVAQTEVGGGS